MSKKIVENWIGATSKQDAEEKIQKEFPSGLITRLYEKVPGMWAYKVEFADLDNQEHMDFKEQQQEPDEQPEHTLEDTPEQGSDDL